MSTENCQQTNSNKEELSSEGVEEEAKQEAADLQEEEQISENTEEPGAEEEVSQEAEPSQIEELNTEIESLREQLNTQQEELASIKKEIDYAKAETQTAIQRSRKDLAQSLNRHKRQILTRLLKVADTFQQTSKELEGVERNESNEVMLSAVEMAIKDFHKTLDGEGLETLDPQGEVFDPNFHEAQLMLPTADAEPNTIIEVLRIGYRIDDIVLRPPQVVVAKELPEAKDNTPEEKND